MKIIKDGEKGTREKIREVGSKEENEKISKKGRKRVSMEKRKGKEKK